MTKTLVELCAGSAAVSLAWLKSDAPISWQGGKRGYRHAILAALGQQPGAGKGQEVVLVEPGPWGEAWDLWRTPQGRADTCDRLRAWQDEDPRALWDRLRKAPVPEGLEDRVAVWAVLQVWSFGRKPVVTQGDGWDGHGFCPVTAYRAEQRQRLIAAGKRHDWAGDKSTRLPDLIAALEALPDLSRVRVLRCRAEEVPPIPGALVYIDGPYEQTTCAYGHVFPRADQLEVAARWREAGARVVCISEQEPLHPRGQWWHMELGGPAGFGRTWSKQRREFLTLSRPPAGQMSLLTGGA